MGKLIDADRLKDIIDYAILANVPADAENTKEEKWNDWIQTVIDRQPTVEAIPKADYETRLKADMAAMLEDLRLDFQEAELAGVFDNKELIFADEVDDLIQQEINNLKED